MSEPAEKKAKIPSDMPPKEKAALMARYTAEANGEAPSSTGEGDSGEGKKKKPKITDGMTPEEKEALRLKMKAEAKARKAAAQATQATTTAGSDSSSGTAVSFEEKQSIKRFQQKKKFVLENLRSICSQDFSPKGSVDGRCKPVMDILNSHPDYVTTSSCSGRVALFHLDAASLMSGGSDGGEGGVVEGGEEILVDAEESSQIGPNNNNSNNNSRKRGTGGKGWLFVSHEPATEKELNEMVKTVIKESGTNQGKEEEEASTNTTPSSVDEGQLSYKSEQFVMHVQCRTLEAAKKLLHIAATKAGYRNSGMTVGKHFTTVAIRHASTLDTPLIVNHSGEFCVCADPQYLLGLFKHGNARLRHNFDQMDRLASELAKGLV